MRRDDDLDSGGYRATADRWMLIPVAIVLALLVLVIAALVFVNKKDKMPDAPAALGDTVVLDTEEVKSTEADTDDTGILEKTRDGENLQSKTGGHVSAASGV